MNYSAQYQVGTGAPGLFVTPYNSNLDEINLNYARQRDLMPLQHQYAMDLASLPINAQMSRFNTVLPMLSSQFGNLQSMMATAGGQSGPSPEITVGGVLNPQQVQQQVNASRAANDQATQGRIMGMQQNMAGRGFGTNSPLAQALSTGMQNQNLATNTANERETRLNAAQMNAGQVLKSQQAREQSFSNRQNESIERTKPYFSSYNALLASLAGLV